MNILKRSFVALFATLLTMVGLSSPAFAAEAGYISGTVKADTVSIISICAATCAKEENGAYVGGMSAPEYYATNVSKDAFKTKSKVEAGSYKIHFYGRIYASSNDYDWGYLRAAPGGYELVKKFSDATWFEAKEGLDLNVGTLNLALDKGKDTTVFVRQSVSSYGTNATVLMDVKNVAKGTTVVIKTYGCGKKQTVRKVTRTGSYTYKWNDNEASKHYGKTLRFAIVAKFSDGSSSKLHSPTFDVSKFRWKC